jgi:hypothetical protein
MARPKGNLFKGSRLVLNKVKDLSQLCDGSFEAQDARGAHFEP